MSEDRGISKISDQEEPPVAKASPDVFEDKIDEPKSDPASDAIIQVSTMDYSCTNEPDTSEFQKNIDKCEPMEVSDSEGPSPMPLAKPSPYKTAKRSFKRPDTLKFSVHESKQGRKSPFLNSPTSPLKRKMSDLDLKPKTVCNEIPTSRRRLSSDGSSESSSDYSSPSIQLPKQQEFPSLDPGEGVQLPEGEESFKRPVRESKKGRKSPFQKSPTSPLKRKLCDLDLKPKTVSSEIPTSRRRLSSDGSTESPSESIQLPQQQECPRSDSSESLPLSKQVSPSLDPGECVQLPEEETFKRPDILNLSVRETKQGRNSPFLNSPTSPLKRKMCDLDLKPKAVCSEIPTSRRQLSSDGSSESPSESIQLPEEQECPRSDSSESIQLAEEQDCPRSDSSESIQLPEEQECPRRDTKSIPLPKQEESPSRDPGEGVQLPEGKESPTKKISIKSDSQVCSAPSSEKDESSLFKRPNAPTKQYITSPFKPRRIIEHQRPANIDPSFPCRQLGCGNPAKVYKEPTGKAPAFHIHGEPSKDGQPSDICKEELVATQTSSGLEVHKYVRSPSKYEGHSPSKSTVDRARSPGRRSVELVRSPGRRFQLVRNPDTRPVEIVQRETSSGPITFKRMRNRTPSGRPEIVNYAIRSPSTSPEEHKDRRPPSRSPEKHKGRRSSRTIRSPEEHNPSPSTNMNLLKRSQSVGSSSESQRHSRSRDRDQEEPRRSQSCPRPRKVGHLIENIIDQILSRSLPVINPGPDVAVPEQQTKKQKKESPVTSESSADDLCQQGASNLPKTRPKTARQSPKVPPLTGKKSEDSLCQEPASTSSTIDQSISESADPNEGTSSSESDDEPETELSPSKRPKF